MKTSWKTGPEKMNWIKKLQKTFWISGKTEKTTLFQLNSTYKHNIKKNWEIIKESMGKEYCNH